MTYPYYDFNQDWFWYTGDGTADNSTGARKFRQNLADQKDTVELAGTKARRLSLELTQKPLVRQQKNFVKSKVAGKRFANSRITRVGYKEIIITFSGTVLDHVMFHWFTTNTCVTTNNTPSAGYYKHVSTSADTFPSEPHYFNMVQILRNDAGAETSKKLFMGCIVTRYEETCDQVGELMGTYTISCAKMIPNANVPTVQPETRNVRSYTLGDAVITWTSESVGPTSYEGWITSWSFVFDNGNKLFKPNSDFAVTGLMGNIDCHAEFNFVTKQENTYDDSQNSPQDNLDKDFTIKFSRDTANDYWQVIFTDLFQELIDEGFGEDGTAIETYKIEMNLRDAGSTYNLEEINDTDDDAYEDAV